MELRLTAPHDKQSEFLALTGEGTGISTSHFVGGRGSGKTHAGAYKLLISALTYNSTLPHLWTFPSFRDCLDIGLRTWREAIPRALWEFRRGDMQIVILPNTSKETIIDMRSRMVDSSGKDPFRGPTYCCALNDEPGKDKSNAAWQLILATLRHPRAARKWCDTTSTPRMGWYYNLVHQDGAHAVYATSYDNPYIDRHWVDGLMVDYSSEFARQEIMAEWISQSGRVWDNADLSEMWPRGNLHWHRYDPNRPYVLGFDLGVRSGWVIIQTVEPVNEYGQPVEGHPSVDVIVGEYTPNNEGAQQTLARIEQQFGLPTAICVGADVGTRSVADAGVTPAIVLRNRGWMMPMRVCKNPYASKQLQHMVLSGLWHNAKNQRRLCVSKDLFRGDAQNKRGVVEMVEQDTWPETERSGEYLVKDKKGGGVGLEDIRDALLYWAIMMHPPSGVSRVQSH